MAISGSTCSTCTSSYLSASDTNSLRQQEKTQNLNAPDNESQNKQPTEFILRGELLEDAVQNNNGFRDKTDQTIYPANQTAINRYEVNSRPTNDPLISQQQGQILDAYA